MEKRGAVDIANSPIGVNQVHPQHVGHGAQVVAVGVVVADHPLIVGLQGGLQLALGSGSQEHPVEIVLAKLVTVTTQGRGGIQLRIEAEAHQPHLIGQQGVL